jgi:hypothetical protein
MQASGVLMRIASLITGIIATSSLGTACYESGSCPEATLTVTPTSKTWKSWEMPANGEVLLENIAFEYSESGGIVQMPSLTITDTVGWFPG